MRPRGSTYPPRCTPRPASTADPDLAIAWPEEVPIILSDKNPAPSLEEARSAGLLPRYSDSLIHAERLRSF